MTATMTEGGALDVETAPVDRCQQQWIDRTRPACPDPALWTVTFTAVYSEASTRKFRLCGDHAQDWARHLAECGNCGRLIEVSLEPIPKGHPHP